MTKKKKHPRLTPARVKKYIEAGGGFCPFCGEDDQEHTGHDNEGSTATYECWLCLACGSRWTETFHLAGLSDDTEGHKSEDFVYPPEKP